NPPRRYRFEARLDGEDRILCVSHQPFVDAARVLVDEGCDPTEILTMRHVGSETIALTAQLGAAAKCMVEEGSSDGPRFVQHVPWSSDPTVKQAAACRTYGATRRSPASAAHPQSPADGGGDTDAAANSDARQSPPEAEEETRSDRVGSSMKQGRNNA